MRQYNVSQQWVDPFDTLQERRTASRFPVKLRLSITVDHQATKRQIVGPAIILDLSVSGMRLRTRHKLRSGQQVSVALPTESFQGDIILPEAFIGSAHVVRSAQADDSTYEAALSFGDLFTNNMEFVLFVEYLQRATKTLAE